MGDAIRIFKPDTLIESKIEELVRENELTFIDQNQYRFFNFIIKKIHEQGLRDFYIIPYEELDDIFNINKNLNYFLGKLSKLHLVIEHRIDEKIFSIACVSSLVVDTKEKLINIKVNEEFKKLIIKDCKKTEIDLLEINKLTGSHEMKLYELFIMHKNSVKKIEIDEFKYIMSMETYETKILRLWVKKWVENLNEKTRLKIRILNPLKKGKTITHLLFDIKVDDQLGFDAKTTLSNEEMIRSIFIEANFDIQDDQIKHIARELHPFHPQRLLYAIDACKIKMKNKKCGIAMLPFIIECAKNHIPETQPTVTDTQKPKATVTSEIADILNKIFDKHTVHDMMRGLSIDIHSGVLTVAGPHDLLQYTKKNKTGECIDFYARQKGITVAYASM